MFSIALVIFCGLAIALGLEKDKENGRQKGEIKMPDKLDKCYYWHITTLAKLKLLRKELKRKCL